ncbi:hypothetical protein NQ314_010054 [Rhamnusium bicolor]|uniref:Uncharacterized protein n=1 Tax=Rhamnusium bicolor TaxID=1586634 RepID=A0AAV8XV21_9CUCU|nr:hypothetical protein NQ314_010054 [Rhamnusium bicolor]
MKEFRRDIKTLISRNGRGIKLGKKKRTASSAVRHTDSAHQPVRDTRRCANCSTTKKRGQDELDLYDLQDPALFGKTPQLFP